MEKFKNLRAFIENEVNENKEFFINRNKKRKKEINIIVIRSREYDRTLTEIAFEHKLNTEGIFEDEELFPEEKLLLFHSVHKCQETIERSSAKLLNKFYIETDELIKKPEITPNQNLIDEEEFEKELFSMLYTFLFLYVLSILLLSFFMCFLLIFTDDDNGSWFFYFREDVFYLLSSL